MDKLRYVGELLQAAWAEFQDDEAEQQGAALAYYAMFSIFPLLILLLAIFGAVIGSEDNVRAEILNAVSTNFSPQLAETLGQTLEVVADQSGGATIVGIITLLIGASGAFLQLERAFNKIWDVPNPPEQASWWETIKAMLKDRIFSFGMVLTVGFLLLISMALTGITSALLTFLSDIPVLGGVFGFIIGLAVSIMISSLVFALLYRYLPKVDHTWRDVLPGAIATGVMWEIAKRLLAWYIGTSTFASAYGAIGTALVLMVWIYFSSQVLFFGAELTQVYTQRKRTLAELNAPEMPEPARVRKAAR